MASTEEIPEAPRLLRDRRAVSDARRAEARERDDARYRLAGDLAAGVRLEIDRDKGYLVVPPGTIAEADAASAAANELIDSIGHEELLTHAVKGGYMAKDFVPPALLELDSPFLRFALSESVVGPIAAYLGLVPLLTKIDVWYSVHVPNRPRGSQTWHLDGADTTQVKVWIHLNDVTREQGPLTALEAAASEELADQMDYDVDGADLSDDQVEAFAADGRVRFEGPAGTIDFVDTSRCFHFGSRLEENAEPRKLFMLQYVTPYSFKFTRERAPYRTLAAGTDDELRALLLGGA